MRIVLLHQAYTTPREAGGTRHHEFGRYLQERGHTFTVVTSAVSYISGEAGSTGGDETVDGIRIVRAWSPKGIHKSFARRFLGYAAFSATSFLALMKERDADIVWGTTPSLPQAAAAALAAKLRRRPFLLEVRDLWPKFAVALGVLRNPVLVAAAERLERWVYAAADAVVVNSPAYREHLVACGVAPERVHLVPNGVEIGDFPPVDVDPKLRAELFGDAAFGVLYTGAVGPANDLDVLVAAARLLRDRPDVAFAVVGDGKDRPRLKAAAEAEGLRNVRFLPPRPKAEMGAVLAAADVCFAHLRPIPEFTTTFPNKVFDYMAARRPVLLGIDGVIRDVVEKNEAGLFVAPGDAEALVAGVEAYLSDPERRRRDGLNGRTAVECDFNRGAMVADLETSLRAATEAAARKKRGGVARRAGKRAVDIVGSATGLILLAPVMLGVAVAVRASMGGPVLFRQERAGLHGQPFKITKFRTMTDEKDASGALLPDGERLTRVGAFLRAATLDELPELFNVLKGDLSLVGPRPLHMRYLPRYSASQARRHDVKPGLTGWAVVHGRNALSWDERLALDVWYVDHASFWVDLKVLLRTVGLVLLRRGVTAKGHATMPEFGLEGEGRE